MREIRTSGSMSGDGKRSVAAWPKLPRPSSTLPLPADQNLVSGFGGAAEMDGHPATHNLRRGLDRSLSPLLGQPNSGLPEFAHYDWPKSDISDFG